MIVAHLPAGYLLYRLVGRRSRPMLAAALTGAVFPDFDLIWFYLVDHQALHHHRYWVHIPGFWLMSGAVALGLAKGLAPKALPVLALFLVSVMLHLVLETIGGGIAWLWPFNDTLYALVEVPATQSHFILSFIFHWTFLAELALTAAASVLIFTRKQPDL